MPIVRIAVPVYLPRSLYHPLRQVKRALLEYREQRLDTPSVFDHLKGTQINKARLEHLASLNLELANSTILDVGSGIGLLTEFFEKLGCEILSTDARPENVAEHRRRYPHRRVELEDLSIQGSHDRFGEFDIVFCYGTLYHLADPSLAIIDLAGCCKRFFLLETCVNPVDNGGINPVREQADKRDQSFYGRGCRPGRDWIFSELHKHFPFVYLTASQPDHPEFPLNWPAPVNSLLSRAVFVASRHPLSLPRLTESLPSTQLPL